MGNLFREALTDFFTLLRNKARSEENRPLGFAEDLYNETSWYLAYLDSKKAKNEKDHLINHSFQVPAQEKIHSHAPKKLAAKGKNQDQRPSSVVSRPRQPLLSPSWAKHVKDLDNCRKCREECINNRPFVVHDFKEEVFKRDLLILFVGDFPKEEERNQEREKKSFAGESGELLRKIVMAMNLKEDEFAFSLLSKCHPEDDELVEEMSLNCLEHLKREIVLLRPKFVVSLGALATRFLLEKKERLSQIHGQIYPKVFQVDGETPHQCKIVPLFHPDYLLINPNMKKTTWTDLQKIMKALEGL